MELVDENVEIDAILATHAEVLGLHRLAYRNHVYRVLNLVRHLAPDEPMARYAASLAFHDLGIWTHRTFDYLEPSAELLDAHLRSAPGLDRAAALLALEWHHKLTPYRGTEARLVEAVRRADLVDVSLGLVRSGVPSALLRELRRRFPTLGFHRLLLRLALRNLLRAPTRPLPMLRW